MLKSKINLGNCIKEVNVVKGRVTMKFKKTNKCKAIRSDAQELVDSIKSNKIIVK